MIWILAHDAGGAEILSSWIAREGKACEVACVLEGPAIKIFDRKLGQIKLSRSREEFQRDLTSLDQVITGSGWGSDLEFIGIQVARDRGAQVATWIDHWVNYQKRFERGSKLAYPHELWVCDEFQENIARAELPPMKIVMRKNPYFLDIEEQWKSMNENPKPKGRGRRWLFIGEALSEANPEYLGILPEELPEVRCLHRFLEFLAARNQQDFVRLRMHPAEQKTKYQSTLNSSRIAWEWSNGTSLLDDCAWANDVVGISSMALVIALLGKRSVTSMALRPGWKCPIPWDGIKVL